MSCSLSRSCTYQGNTLDEGQTTLIRKITDKVQQFHMYTHTHTHTRAHTRAHTHGSRTQTHTHTHAHTTHTDTQTNTHTHHTRTTHTPHTHHTQTLTHTLLTSGEQRCVCTGEQLFCYPKGTCVSSGQAITDGQSVTMQGAVCSCTSGEWKAHS